MYIDTYGILYYKSGWRANLLIDSSIGKYYRRLYSIFHWRTRQLKAPMNGSHVSVVRSETPLRKEFWGLYAGSSYWLRIFIGEIFTNNNAYWFPVYCEAASVLRAKLGLSRTPKVPFHYCIGYVNDGKQNR